MRKRMVLSTVLILTVVIGLFSLISVKPAPVYSQDIEENIPDLSGINIYFSEANGEYSQFDRSSAGVSRFAGLLRLAGANLFTLEWRKGIPSDADLIIMPAPGSDPPQDQVARLWAYLQRGGKVLVVADVFDDRGRVSRALGSRGLFELTWHDLGVQAREDAIVIEGDLQDVDVTETDRDGNVTFEFSGELPEITIQFQTTVVDENHPVTGDLVSMLGAVSSGVSGTDSGDPSNLDSFYFDGARSVQIDGSIAESSVTPLIFTEANPNMYGETDFARYVDSGYIEYNIGEDSQRGDLILAASYEDPQLDARMILIGDGDFIRNGAGFLTSPSYSGSFVYPMNVQFALRSVAWLLDREPVTLDLPTPATTATATTTPTPIPTATATPAGTDDSGN